MDLERYMLNNNFQLVDTGGGCNAYRKEIDKNTYLLITKADDPSVPEEMEEDVIIGYYNADNDEQIKSIKTILKRYFS